MQVQWKAVNAISKQLKIESVVNSWNLSIIPVNDTFFMPVDRFREPVDMRFLFTRKQMTGKATGCDMQSWSANLEYRKSTVPIGGWIPIMYAHSQYHVGTGHQYLLIQDAVDAAKPDATIILHPGSYSGRVVVSKAVRIQSSGDVQSTIVTGSWEIRNDVIVSGITFFISHHMCALYVDSGRTTVTDCTIIGPYRRVGRRQSIGIKFGQTVEKPFVFNNKFSSWHRAVELLGGSYDGAIVGNVFEDNERALVVEHAARLTVERNTFVGNHYGFDLSEEVGFSYNITIRRNKFDRNRKSLRHLVWSWIGTAMREKIDARHNFWVQGRPTTAASYWEDGDIYPGVKGLRGFLVDPVLDEMVSAVDFPPVAALSTRGRCDVRWTGKRWFVQPDALSYAVAIAPRHSVIHVHPGSYHGSIVINKSVTVAATGQISKTVFHGQFVITSGVQVRIVGLTIQTKRNNAITLKDQGSILTVENCVFLYDSANSYKLSQSVALEVDSSAKNSILLLSSVRFTGWTSSVYVNGALSTISIHHTDFSDCSKAVEMVDPATVNFTDNSLMNCREGIVVLAHSPTQSKFHLSRNNFIEVARTVSIQGKTLTHFWTADKNFWFPAATLAVSVLMDDRSSNDILSPLLERQLRLNQSATKNVFVPHTYSPVHSVFAINAGFQYIQDAVRFANPWDTVVVRSGVYSNAHVHITKALKMTGEGLPVLLGSITVSHSHVILAGLKVHCVSDWQHNASCIHVDMGVSHVTFIDLHLNGSTNQNVTGIRDGGQGSVRFGLFSSVFVQFQTAVYLPRFTENVIIEGNQFVSCDRAVVVHSNSSARIQGNEFQSGCKVVIKSAKYTSKSRVVVGHNNFGVGSLIVYEGTAGKTGVHKNYWAEYSSLTNLISVRPLQLPQPADLATFRLQAAACFKYEGIQIFNVAHG